MEKFFSNVLKLSENQARFCEETLTKKDLYNSLESMPNCKYPGNGALTKDFMKRFGTN